MLIPHVLLLISTLQMVKENEKARVLEQEMHAMGDDQRVIVFANTKRQVGAALCVGCSPGFANTKRQAGCCIACEL